MRYLYMFVGLPLTGKTTFRERMFSNFAGLIVSADDQLMAMAAPNKMTYNEAFKVFGERAGQAAFDLGKYAAQKTVSVVWDQTNLTKKSRKRKLELFSDISYYKVAYVFLSPTSDVLMERQQNPDREGKTIPLSVLNNMRNSYEQPSLEEGFHEIRFVNGNYTITMENDDNDNGC